MPTERKIFIGIIIILILVIIGTSVNGYIKAGNITKLQDQIATSTYNSVMPFTTQRAKDSSEIVIQGQLVASKDAEIVKHIEKEQKLFKLASNVQIKTSVRVDTLLVPYKDSAKVITLIDSSGNKDEFLKLPLRAVDIDSNFKLDVTVLKTGVEVNYLEIPNSTTVVIGEEGNIFKRTPIVKITNSNKYIITESAKNIIVVDPKAKAKSWKAPLIGGVIGFSIGTIGTTLLYIYTHK